MDGSRESFLGKMMSAVTPRPAPHGDSVFSWERLGEARG